MSTSPRVLSSWTALLISGVALSPVACADGPDRSPPESRPRPVALASAAPTLEPTEAIAREDGVVRVYKSPTCGCCADWVDHLREAGFRVEVSDREDVTRAKVELGVPPSLGSCHTAVVDGYVVEGHVPAEDIRRLLAERPDVVGLAVPGMPAGSPGMELPGGRTDPYDVVAFDPAGATSVFSSHR